MTGSFRIALNARPLWCGAGLIAAVALVSGCAPTPVADPVAPEEPADSVKVCRADAYQGYIGKNRSELPTTPADEAWRVVCSSCAVTMDYRADRLTIVYDDQTNLIQSARCG